MTEEKIRQIEACSLEEAMKRLEAVVAEMSAEEKNAISHRARACEKMLQIMKEINQ